MEHTSETSVDEGQHREVFVSQMLHAVLFCVPVPPNKIVIATPLAQWCASLGSHFIRDLSWGM